MTSVRQGEGRATLRVRDEPFFITGRGLAVVCELVDGALFFGPHGATVAFPDGAGGTRVETVSAIEAALGLDGVDRPALLFPAERGDRETAFRAVLQPGVLLALTGPATEPAPGTMSPAEFRARLAAVRRKGNWAFARLFWGVPLFVLLQAFQPSWLGIHDPPFWFWIVVGVLYLSFIHLLFSSYFKALRRIDDSSIRCPHCGGHLLTDRGDANPLLSTGRCPRCATQVLDAIDPRYT